MRLVVGRESNLMEKAGLNEITSDKNQFIYNFDRKMQLASMMLCDLMGDGDVGC